MPVGLPFMGGGKKLPVWAYTITGRRSTSSMFWSGWYTSSFSSMVLITGGVTSKLLVMKLMFVPYTTSEVTVIWSSVKIS